LDGQLGDAHALGHEVEGRLDDRLLGLLTARAARSGLMLDGHVGPQTIAGSFCSGCATGRGLPGIHRATTAAPSSAMPAETREVTCMLCTNASLARLIMLSPRSPSARATSLVAVMDSPPGWRTPAGSPTRAGAISPRETDESSERGTATPSAPATWRTVLLLAEPTPAFSRGSDSMMAVVAGGMMLAIATPCTKKTASSTGTGVSRSKSV